MEFIRKHFRKLAFIALGFVFIVTGLSIYELRKIRFDYDFESFFPTNDPDLDEYLEFRQTFEYDNEFILLAIENKKGIFREDFLDKISALSDSLKNVPDVTYISSPTTLENLIITGFGPVKIPLIHLGEPERFASDSAQIYGSEELVGSFFARDAKSVSIYIKTTEGISKAKSDSLLANINTELARYQFDGIYTASKARGQKVYLEKISGEFVQFFIASFFLVVLFLFISFRSFWGVWVPVVIVLLSIVWTLALMTATGKALDIMTILLPTMMFVVGMSDVVHLVTKYVEELRSGNTDKFDALIKTIRETGFATFITLITTSLGFLTLLNSHVLPIRDFGLYTSLGVFIAFILSYSIMPLVLYLLPTPKIAQKKFQSDFWHKQLHRMLLWVFRNGKAITVGAVLLAGISVYGITRIELNNHLIEGLTRKDELRQDFEFFEKNYSGVRPFEILITPADTTSSLWNPAELKAIDRLEKYLRDDFGVGFIISPATLVKGMNKALNNGNNAYFVMPQADEDIVALTDQMEQFRKRKEMKNLVTKDGKQARVTGKMPDIGSKIFLERGASLDTFMKNEPVMKPIKVHLTGAALMLDKNNKYLVDNTLQGLLISILVVALISALIHRNWRMMLIAIVPNLFPIVVIGGIMGYFGIEMKSATSIIFSIAFGIATDDTIHFLARLKLEMGKGKRVLYCVKRSFLSTGKAVIVTSLILCGGFFSLITSGFESTFYFGLLVSITLFVAVLTDLLLFPLLVVWLIKDKKAVRSEEVRSAP
ncbi:MAG TPA: MMPL family transporter [Bacteroidia bacterium]|nr:MMPL family transporter [Bacteroidia bacterium]